MNKEVWKICWKDPGHFNTPHYYSVMTIFGKLTASYSLIYKIGKRTIPESGRIFCFDTPKNIVEFIKHSVLTGYEPELVIMRGIAYNVGYPKFVAHKFSDIPIFWQQKQRHKSITCFDKSSIVLSKKFTGTITCAAFEPFEQFTYDQFMERFVDKMKEIV